jgi:pimeloyl-ACP methyl ester carboxylesterase
MDVRSEVTFESDGTRCAAWLYRPGGAEPVPIVVMGHGLGGVREMRLDAYAERFSAAGYACLVFDYRHFGASEGEPRQLLDIDRQLEDWAAAIAFARTLDGIDPDRVVVWGTSFGGGHAIVAGARDQRVAAVIAQCPFTDGPASLLAAPPLSLAKVTALGLRDAVGALTGGRPTMVPTAGPPRSAALMATRDAEPGYLGIVPDGAPFRNEVAARFGLRVGLHRPGRHAAKLACPALFCICEHDSVAPARAAQRDAARAPRGEVRLYPYGHFEIYANAPFERVVADQLAFLAQHLPVTSTHTEAIAR